MYSYQEVKKARTVGIGIQDFSKIRENNYFYIDKTAFTKEWWESFFSIEYVGRGDLFKGLSIWKEEKYRNLHGTYPVISLSFLVLRNRITKQHEIRFVKFYGD